MTRRKIMRTFFSALYKVVMLIVLVGIFFAIAAVYTVKQGQLVYEVGKDTRTTAHRVFHPFTSDAEYTLQSGGGIDRLVSMFK
jgi:hypothetical protein